MCSGRVNEQQRGAVFAPCDAITKKCVAMHLLSEANSVFYRNLLLTTAALILVYQDISFCQEQDTKVAAIQRIIEAATTQWLKDSNFCIEFEHKLGFAKNIEDAKNCKPWDDASVEDAVGILAKKGRYVRLKYVFAMPIVISGSSTKARTNISRVSVDISRSDDVLVTQKIGDKKTIDTHTTITKSIRNKHEFLTGMPAAKAFLNPFSFAFVQNDGPVAWAFSDKSNKAKFDVKSESESELVVNLKTIGVDSSHDYEITYDMSVTVPMIKRIAGRHTIPSKGITSVEVGEVLESIRCGDLAVPTVLRSYSGPIKTTEGVEGYLFQRTTAKQFRCDPTSKDLVVVVPQNTSLAGLKSRPSVRNKSYEIDITKLTLDDVQTTPYVLADTLEAPASGTPLFSWMRFWIVLTIGLVVLVVWRLVRKQSG
jgi:hypothetical protein